MLALQVNTKDLFNLAFQIDYTTNTDLKLDKKWYNFNQKLKRGKVPTTEKYEAGLRNYSTYNKHW